MKKVAILQSNYIPWKGYFDLINMVDEFIFYDEMQYTKRDWRNRNQIRTPNGMQWITIPVKQTSFTQRICDIRVAQPDWAKKHWKAISQNYAKAAYFKKYKELFEQVYFGLKTELLSEINYHFIVEINKILGIDTKISWSTDYILEDGKTERLVSLCRQAQATTYISGPAAKDYIDKSLFDSAGLAVEWIDYSGYPPYKQCWEPFEHGVTVMDLIFNCGPDAPKYMKSFE